MNQVAEFKPDASYGLPMTGLAPGLALMFNEALYARCKQIAQIMASANGFTPKHLIGQSEACFAVVTRSITWKLDPFAVACATYQTPGGAVGFEGKLVQAILENSGKLEGNIKFEHIGDWDKIRGRWKKKTSDRGKEYAVQDWKDEDEIGLGVIVSAQVIGEVEPRVLKVYMRECFPRNSTLWALRPSQQICYTAVRAFANVAAPGLLMGVPFDTDADGAGLMVEVNERPAPPTRTKPPVWDKTAAEEEAEEIAAGVAKLGEEAPAHDAETGEIVEPEGEAEAAEFGTPDAYKLGEEAFEAKRSMYSNPREWEQMGKSDWIDAFRDGWKAAETEAKAKA